MSDYGYAPFACRCGWRGWTDTGVCGECSSCEGCDSPTPADELDTCGEDETRLCEGCRKEALSRAHV